MRLPIEADGLRISEAPARRRLLLRAAAEDPGFAEAVRQVFGLALPSVPCSSAEGAHARCLWLGPTTWLVEACDGEAGRAMERLGAMEVTDALLVLAVAGPRAPDLLAVGTGIDLHPSAFPPGRVVRTLFGRLGATLHRMDQGDALGFHLHLDRAAGRWLAGWLEAAVRGLDL